MPSWLLITIHLHTRPRTSPYCLGYLRPRFRTRPYIVAVSDFAGYIPWWSPIEEVFDFECCWILWGWERIPTELRAEEHLFEFLFSFYMRYDWWLTAIAKQYATFPPHSNRLDCCSPRHYQFDLLLLSWGLWFPAHRVRTWRLKPYMREIDDAERCNEEE